jgi:hypothetical protein
MVLGATFANAHAGAGAADVESIAGFTTGPGDRVVTVPDGTYAGGVVDTDRPETGGRYNGWLVVRAQNPGEVVVDLEGAALDVTKDASRIVFVGIRFVNGTVFVQGSDVTFWYTDHSFPADVWVEQAPDPGRPQRGYYRAPRAIDASGPDAERVSLYGVDVHDTGTALIASGSSDVLLSGTTIWNLSDGGDDPADVIHPDAIGLARGGSTRFRVRDSYVRGRVTVADAPGELEGGGPHEELRFQDSWFTESPSAGFIFTVRKPGEPRGISGERRRIRSWGHANGLDRVDHVDGERVEPGSVPEAVDVRDYDVTTDPPPPGLDDPSTRWRRAHPYESWPEVLFGVRAPTTTSPTTAEPSVPQGPEEDEDARWPAYVAVAAGVAVAAAVLVTAWPDRRRRRRDRREARVGRG